jgi:hypothetical protein
MSKIAGSLLLNLSKKIAACCFENLRATFRVCFLTLSLYPVNPLYRPSKNVKNPFSFSCIHHQTKKPFWLQLPPFNSSDKKRKAEASPPEVQAAEIIIARK